MISSRALFASKAMAHRSSRAFQKQNNCRRHLFSTESAPRAGAGLFQRLTSFFVGAGLMALVTQFYLYKELKDGNMLMLQKQADLEKRVRALEK